MSSRMRRAGFRFLRNKQYSARNLSQCPAFSSRRHLEAVLIGVQPGKQIHVLSLEADIANCPSGLIATELTSSEWPAKTRGARPESKSQTHSLLSLEAATARRPSPSIATALNAQSPPSRPPESRSQNLCVPSSVIVKTVPLPSGAGVPPSAPSKLPHSRSQTLSVPSAEAETARLPSGVTVTPLTQPKWPSRARSSWPVSRSQTFSVPSAEAETARWPSGLTATPWMLAEWPSIVRSKLPESSSHTFSVLSEDAKTAR